MKKKDSKLFTLPRGMNPDSENNNSRIKPNLYGWTGIPNCDQMELFTNPYDKLWKDLYGLKVRVSWKRITRGENTKMNKYMKYQLKRLDRLRSDPVKYWNVVRSLLQKSLVFRLSAFIKMHPNWSRDLTLGQVKSLVKSFKKLLKSFDTDSELNRIVHYIDFKRVYFWDRNKWRPLVPSVPWRMMGHMINNFLVQFSWENFLPSQHGFIPGRGCLTAWQELITKVFDKPWILETDLKQFFPSVRPAEVTGVLSSMGVSEYMLSWIGKINRSNFIIPREVKLVSDTELILKRLEYLDLFYFFSLPVEGGTIKSLVLPEGRKDPNVISKLRFLGLQYNPVQDNVTPVPSWLRRFISTLPVLQRIYLQKRPL